MGCSCEGIEEVWVKGRTTGVRESRGTVNVTDLRGVVTHTLADEGPNGPNGTVTQYILSAAEKQLYDGLRNALGENEMSRDAALLGRMIPLETFGPDVLDISRNNLRRRWATSTDWLDDVIAYSLRPGRADDHARAAVARAAALIGEPLGQLIDAVAAGEVEAERDPGRFALAEMIRTMWPEHPAVRRSQATLDEYAMRWWVPVYQHLLDRYGLRLLPGLDIEEFAWPLLALVDHEARTPTNGGRSALAIRVLVSGGTVDAATGSRLTPDEVAARVPPRTQR
ncbi:hypothetical protein [uncultured Gordonia sp.]|uniref:hypothetical protein n=1 Tax=uncultured Gordonia sp. TaxID=198437 RepID=UPI0025979C4C|nr:hypothetical protein [uncultured Gordonia sp.]